MDYKVVFDVVIVILGFYLIFTAVQMKRTGEISTIIIDSNEIIRCKDAKGFIDYIYRKTIIFGAVALLFGILNVINDCMYSFGIFFDIAGVTIFLGILIWFTWHLRKGKEMFCYKTAA